MANDSRSIGDRLRAIDEHARGSANSPGNAPANKEPAEGSRETVMGSGGKSKRSQGAEAGREANVPAGGARKERGHAQ